MLRMHKEMKTKIIIILVMVVIIVTRLWDRMMWISNSGTNKDFVSSPNRSYRFQAPLNLVLFIQGKAPRV